jgi:hypothetical protein
LVVNGATVLGFSAGQTKDENTAQTELGLGSETVESEQYRLDSAMACWLVPAFRAGNDSRFGSRYQWNVTKSDRSRSLLTHRSSSSQPTKAQHPQFLAPVQFNIKLGTEFEKSIDLNFDEGVDVGFAQLSVAGGASATLTAEAGVELTVGIDLDPIGVGTVLPGTRRSSFAEPRPRCSSQNGIDWNGRQFQRPE